MMYSQILSCLKKILHVKYKPGYYLYSCLISLSLYVLVKKYKKRSRQLHLKTLQFTIQQKRAANHSKIEAQFLQDTNADIETRKQIVGLKFLHLKEKLQKGELSCIAVVDAYQWKALQVQKTTNSICFFIENARDNASKLDTRYADKPKPPFFGIPISVKESIQVKGLPQTYGYVAHSADIPTESSLVVQLLERLGGIPFVTTNVPQSLLSWCCANPLYGTTCHPLDASRTPGGSSGGEGALIGAGGSLLGLGTDVGGSIRMPAGFCGIAGLKPTRMRISQIGVGAASKGRPMIDSSVGPMASDVDTVVEFMQYILNDQLYNEDPKVVPMPFNRSLYEETGKLRIGWSIDNGFCTPVPAVQRGIMMAKEILESAGFELVLVNPDKTLMEKILFLWPTLVIIDGSKTIYDKIMDDIPEPLMSKVVHEMGMPNWKRNILAKYCILKGERITAKLRQTTCMTTTQVRQKFAELEDCRLEYAQFWVDNKLDALISPINASLPPAHHIPQILGPAAGYGVAFNVVDYPSGVVPITRATREDVEKLNIHPTPEVHDRILVKANRNSVGLPVSVQCTALPYREEICLRVMKAIESGRSESF